MWFNASIVSVKLIDTLFNIKSKYSVAFFQTSHCYFGYIYYYTQREWKCNVLVKFPKTFSNNNERILSSHNSLPQHKIGISAISGMQSFLEGSYNSVVVR